MAIGLAFVDVLGDTSRAAPQIERDMGRVLATVSDAIQPVEIQAAVEAGTEADLTREINRDLRAVSAAADAVQVNASLDPDTRARLRAQLRETAASLRAARSEIQLRVDERPVVESTVAAVEEAVHVAEATAPAVEIETRIDNDSVTRAARDFTGLQNALLGGAGAAGVLGKGLLGFATAAQSGFALVSTLKQLAPAAALAAPAILAGVSATGALKLAMSGVGDAVKAALDPSDPEKFDEALKNLSPEAQKFAKGIQALQPAFKDLQQSVQNAVFKDLAGTLKTTAADVLPLVKTQLVAVGGTFNEMAKGAAGAADQLAKEGTLGKALKGARDAIGEFAGSPGLVVTAFGQLAAAAAPQLDRVAKSLSGALSDVTEQLSGAFASGNLDKVIKAAVDQLYTLVDVAGNVFKIFGNIVGTANGFQGIVGVLDQVTKVLADVTGSDEAQHAFQSLFDTLNLLTKTALPLVESAFKGIGQIVIAIAPGVQTLITSLGAALLPVLDALGPVLAAAAGAVGSLVIALSPLLVAAGQLVAALLPALTPLFDGLTKVFMAAAPVVAQIATQLVSFLVPILMQLPGVLTPIISSFASLAEQLFPQALNLLTELGPSFSTIQKALLDLAQALAPVLVQIADLSLKILEDLSPVIPPLIKLIADVARLLATEFAGQIETVVVPALQGLSQLLAGDSSAAFTSFETVAKGVIEGVIREFVLLPVRIIQAIGDLSQSLFRIGEDIIRSLIHGITSQIDSLGDVLGNVTQFIKDHKGPIEVDRKLLVPAGQAIMGGLIQGLRSQRGDLGNELAGITGMFGSASGLTVRPGVASPLAAGQVGRQFASTAPQPTGQQPAILAQVFVGDREITDIVDARVTVASRVQGRQILTGTRR